MVDNNSGSTIDECIFTSFYLYAKADYELLNFMYSLFFSSIQLKR
jgi:hypothetical protein